MKRVLWLPYLALSLLVAALLPLSTSELSAAVHFDIVSGSAALAALLGAIFHHSDNRLPWVLMAMGLVAWAAGDIIWHVYAVGLDQDPFPSIADGAYLIGYAFVAASLFLLAHRRATGPDRSGMIDAAIITLGLGTVIWAIAGQPLVGGLDGWELAFTAAYPLADILLLGALTRFLFTRASSIAAWMIALGLVSTLIFDILLAVRYSTGRGSELLENYGWMLSVVLIATAIMHPSSKALESPAPRTSSVTLSDTRLAALAAASLIAPVASIIGAIDDRSWQGVVVDAASIALFALVVLRMAGLTRSVQDQATMLAALARTDPLTGAGNRLSWNESLPIEISRAQRLGSAVSIAMLDLDNFKAFNDNYGHQRGDELLRLSIENWRKDLRSIDLLTRYGGEEFAIILPGCVLQDAIQIVERMRASVPFGETCSAGVVMWDGKESGDALTKRADEALYAAKSAGRDRSVAGAAF